MSSVLTGMQVSAIVPTLNEEQTLTATLKHLLEHTDRIVVSDGGSTDGTESVARAFPVTWVDGPPGRGRQLNRGAAAVDTSALLFVHADTCLPEGALPLIIGALESGYVGGGFSLRFESTLPIMAVGSRLVNLRTRLTRVPLGDQAQFVLSAQFHEMEGYRDWPILEDLDFMRRLKKRGRVAVLPAAVTTSDRRYARRGVWRTVATNWLIWGLFLAGVRPEKLASLYRDVR